MSDKPRNVLRSAPLPTKHIARQMTEDEARREDAETGSVFAYTARRYVLGTPAATDNGQCWSEEIFSLLNP